MDQQVLSVSCPAGECLAANVTLVRPVTRVRHHMLLQPVILREGLAALLAHEALPALVLQQDVLVEILLGDHTPLANLAFVLGLEVRPFLMHVQRIAVGAGLATNVADDGALLVLEAHVQSHVALHFELLTAELAFVFVIGAMLALQMLLQLAAALTLEVARVARVIRRLAGTAASHAFARTPAGMFPAEVRIIGRLVRALVAAQFATVRHSFYIL